MNPILIDADTFRLRLQKLCVRSGSIGLPRNPIERHVVLKAVALALGPGPRTQPEVAEILEAWLAGVGRRIGTDHVALRRALVDYGYLSRDPAGLHYEVIRGGPRTVQFAADIGKIDLEALVREGLEQQEQRRRAHLAGLGSNTPGE